MKKRILSAITTALLMTTYTGVYAQELPDTRTQLIAISKRMLAEGDESFILVQALVDGLIKNGQPYTFKADQGDISINGKQLEEPYKKQYGELMNQFAAQNNKHGYYSSTGEHFNVNEVLDPNSDFRKGHAISVANAAASEQRKEYDNLFIAELAKDHLIDTTAGYSIAFKNTGLFINNRKLAGAEYDKYKPMAVKALGAEPQKELDGMFLTCGAKVTNR